VPQRKPAAKKTKRIAVIVVVGLMAYFLSSGPALYLMRRELLAENVVRFVYMPLAVFEEWRPCMVYQRWWYYTKTERDVIEAEETWNADQWLQHAMEQLQKRDAPAAELIRSPQRKEWADSGYLLFIDGWASFESHSSHDSKKIGDIGLLLTSDGVFYTNDFHFCMGESEYHGAKQTQPKDFPHFFELYGVKQGWKKKP
jgi:hypothetical protein